jgi:hypothetical protein
MHARVIITRMSLPILQSPLLRWSAWLGCGTAITVALLVPVPPEVSTGGPLGSSYSFSANLVHIVAYGVWAALTAFLPVSRQQRWGWLALLAVHAGASELLQGLVPTRYPDWADVGWDLLGMSLGVAGTWGWWRSRG